MRESQMQSKITEALERSGWMVIKLIQTTHNGIPDLLALRQGRAVFIEVKAPAGKVAALQTYRINKLQSQGFEALVARSLNEVQHLLTV